MKETEKKKPVKTIPDGVWEAGFPKKEKEHFTTDFQGNGYPSAKEQNRQDSLPTKSQSDKA